MNKLKPIVTVTVLIWFVVTAIYAFYYVTNKLHLPGLEGYEAEWDWQLMFFALVRLPWLLLGLAVIVWIESRYFRSM